ncbi:hypothetical protein AV530_010525 [Patagioenas fasciata monilis]|uniref:Uncharacterized protein n=1 Tax=Patagioenas fasciata monilis TaxID=372326 RepID=A0A1V4KF64_PATFA|nr:hypothetical protein AV530_010525 [Patagioenas fasciata monilis]
MESEKKSAIEAQPRRISSKIKASPKNNRIAVTDFHGTVKRGIYMFKEMLKRFLSSRGRREGWFGERSRAWQEMLSSVCGKCFFKKFISPSTITSISEGR